jgi:hypothetical protein
MQKMHYKILYINWRQLPPKMSIISKSKTGTIAFKGRDSVRSKIVINNNIVEQINK